MRQHRQAHRSVARGAQARHTGVYSLVDVERGLLREALVTDIALERPLAGVRAHMDLQVRLASERRRALHALIRPPLH